MAFSAGSVKAISGEGAYNISVVVFCILSFAVLTFLVVAGF